MPANLSFLPWVRQGAAGAITRVDSLGPTQPAVADLSIALAVNGQALVPPVAVRLRGPADPVGIDTNQVVRTDPRPGTSDFEPNCFPAIEFDRPDFPWLFTPAQANTTGQLRPWLCLVVVRQQAGIQLTSGADSPLPILTIAAPARPFAELPDLRESWAWAHGQVAADDSGQPAAVRAAIEAPHLSLSRLVCPRILAANTDYLACAVPAFELGRKAGLGLTIADAELTAVNALAPAWTLTATTPVQVVLPVYYSWSFRTGAGGDFQSLARQLRIASPSGLGQRTVLIGQPGFTLPATVSPSTTVQVEGALMPLAGNPPPVLWSDPVAQDFETALAAIVNRPGLNQVAAPAADPLLAPPLYGRWHAGRLTAIPRAANWFDELNLDPRWRIAAALGTEVVQEHQEALMASAWEQAAEVQQVNQRLRQLQLSMAVGERLHARHLAKLSEEATLRFASPAFSRVRMASNDGQIRTVTATMMPTRLPVPAIRTAMRRIGRQRGPLSRRSAAQSVLRSADDTWVVRLNFNNALPAPAPPVLAAALVPPPPAVGGVVAAIWNPGFTIAPDGQPLPQPPIADPLPPAWDYPGHFRAAAAAHLTRIRGPLSGAFFPPRDAMAATAAAVRAEMNPRTALADLARALVATGDNVLPPTAPGVTPLGTETVMMAPAFPQPMYEPLKERSQDLLLPGLDRVEPDRVVGLRTNRAFVESYMIGLNVEMASEFLWRGFPTDQRGTYFRHFWGTDMGPAAPADIDDLCRNLGRALGTAPATAPAEQFVLLLRSSLLRRYPNAIIYLMPASASTPPPADIFPIFNGAMEPDVSFVGFPITPEVATGAAGGSGYYVVIQEHPTEPRFGLDAAVTAALATTRSHLPIGTQPPAGVPLKGRTWGRNSAHMAEITRRLPVRITIHAAQLVAPGP